MPNASDLGTILYGVEMFSAVVKMAVVYASTGSRLWQLKNAIIVYSWVQSEEITREEVYIKFMKIRCIKL